MVTKQARQTTTTSMQSIKLLDLTRDKIRFKHYSLSTEKTYIALIKQFILYHPKRHPFIGLLQIKSRLNNFHSPQIKNPSHKGSGKSKEAR